MLQIFQDFGALIASIIGAVLWFARLEARGKANTENIKRIERRMDRSEDETREILREIQKDIKDLIGRLPK